MGSGKENGRLEKRHSEYLEILDNLIQSWESEVVEFKEAKSQMDDDKVGRYFSAISNEANLRGKQYGWLVLGVREVDREIVGSAYKVFCLVVLNQFWSLVMRLQVTGIHYWPM